jgi:hypothetical protein
MAKERPLSIPVILGIKGKGLDEAIKDTKRLSTQLGRFLTRLSRLLLVLWLSRVVSL